MAELGWFARRADPERRELRVLDDVVLTLARPAIN
jgi:hypothetical protein